MPIWLNKQCSILFHLLVPGGKWHTRIDNFNSSANSCSATFQRRLRKLLLPPPSAVTNNSVACGYNGYPIFCHQRRIVATAKSAVSWSVPTLTQPAFAVRSYTP